MIFARAKNGLIKANFARKKTRPPCVKGGLWSVLWNF